MVEVYDTDLKKLKELKVGDAILWDERERYYRKLMNRIFQLTTDLWEYYNLFEKVAETDLIESGKEGPSVAVSDWKHTLIGLDGMMETFCKDEGILHDSSDAFPDRYPVPCEFGTGKALNGKGTEIDMATLDMRDYHGLSENLSSMKVMTAEEYEKRNPKKDPNDGMGGGTD